VEIKDACKIGIHQTELTRQDMNNKGMCKDKEAYGEVPSFSVQMRYSVGMKPPLKHQGKRRKLPETGVIANKSVK
jgi:hypothetical protein